MRARKVVWVSLRYVVSAGEVSRRTAEREEEEHVVVEDCGVLSMYLRWWLLVRGAGMHEERRPGMRAMQQCSSADD